MSLNLQFQKLLKVRARRRRSGNELVRKTSLREVCVTALSAVACEVFDKMNQDDASCLSLFRFLLKCYFATLSLLFLSRSPTSERLTVDVRVRERLKEDDGDGHRPAKEKKMC